jgi:hypothetical protein
MDPADQERLDARFGALWEFARDTRTSVDKLQSWRTTRDAVSRWRSHAVPVLLSLVGCCVSLINLIIYSRR